MDNHQLKGKVSYSSNLRPCTDCGEPTYQYEELADGIELPFCSPLCQEGFWEEARFDEEYDDYMKNKENS